MPELPDVEIFRQYLDSTSLHQQVQKVVFLNRDILWRISPAKFRSILDGKQFQGSARHGKYAFAGLDGNGYLGFHFGMSGSLKYFKAGDEIPVHTRMLIRFVNGYYLAYVSVRKLGKLFIAKDVGTFIGEQQLGPDALAIDTRAFQSIFQNRRGSVKTALMNQQVLAGLGNIYTDEILFQSGIHPTRKCSQVSGKEWKLVHHTMRTVLNAAIKKRAQPERFPASYLTSHRNAGEDCPRCGTQLEIMKVGGRTTYFCPNDQH
ncbi:MAG: DNA-formamidopyrimidine glycosylase family protein [Acidobacteriota bacterium]